MKKIIYSIALVFSLGVILSSCADDDSVLGTPPTEEDAAFTFTPSAANANIINFSGSTDAFLKKWNFGNGTTGTGTNATGVFPVEGTYTVTLTVYTSGGSVSSSREIIIAQTDPSLLDVPVYNMLTGGNTSPDGKTWMVDFMTNEHFGLGPAAGTWPEWYRAAANEKAGTGFYDDKFTFKLAGFSYIQTTNGDVFINGQQGANFPGSFPNGGDLTAPFTAPTSLTWSVVEEDGKQFLNISPGGFIGYYTGVNKYEILTLSADKMFLKYYDAKNDAFAWYVRLVREGYTEPVDPPEYKIEDIQENFDGATLLGFVNDSQATLVKYDNPAPVPINTSAKVGKYVKADGAGGQFGNIQIPLGYKMDLRERNVFTLKVFIPSYNDYTTTGGEPWQTYNTLQKQVAIKLQNSDLAGNAYTTQAEIKYANLATDKWIELTFDFNDFNEYTEQPYYDKVVIQLGGEAIVTGGIFFIDDLKLLP